MTRISRGIVRSDERGSVMLAVMLIMLAVGAMAVSAVVLFGSATRIEAYSMKQSAMRDAADAGLELGRAYITRNPDAYPETGYVRLPASAHPMPDEGDTWARSLTREVYVGPSGVTTGQYGVFGSVVSVVEDAAGNRVVRRLEMVQESFAKFAYFTDDEGGEIYFGSGDRIQGPLHSNDRLLIYQTGAGPTFFGPVSTARTVSDPGRRASFRQGVRERVDRIELPTTTDLSRLRNFASSGGTAFSGNTGGYTGQATTRIEFVAIDINGDGDTLDDGEGFFRIYQSNYSSQAGWVVGTPPSSFTNTEHCGHVEPYGSPRVGEFATASEHTGYPGSWWYPADWDLDGSPQHALTTRSPRCYLGGADELTNGFVASNSRGRWIQYDGGWASPMPAAVAARPDANYLHPLSRAFNPDFKGVIHVAGKVAVSGTLRGRVTLAATSDIIIVDDLVYANHPAGGGCLDILGIFAGGDVIVADNVLNTPQNPGGGYRTYAETPEEVIHGVILTLKSFYTQNYSSGPTTAEYCEGTPAGRGCLYVTGGIIQGTRGAVGTSSGAGYIKRYSYDQCAAQQPPPYFPTTGRFEKGRYYEIDPVGFDIDEYWSRISAGS